MKLHLYVLEAKDLHTKDSYVKLKVGKHKSKTRVLRNTINPVWNEEFVFRVHDLDNELVVSVFEHNDESGFFNGSSGLMGRVQVPLWIVAEKDTQTIPPTWFSLERSETMKRFINEDCGKFLLIVSLFRREHNPLRKHLPCTSNIIMEDPNELECQSISSEDTLDSKCSTSKADRKKLIKSIATLFDKLFHKIEEKSRTDVSSLCSTGSDYEDSIEENQNPTSYTFEEAMQTMQLKSIEQEMPKNLQGGILLDQAYAVSSYELKKFLFAPGSQFRTSLAEIQGTTNLQEGPWAWKSENMYLSRVVSYVKAATKLVGAVKATEEQTYVKADGKEFAILITVSTPEVPCGNTFKVELLYMIIPVPELVSGEESSCLIISLGIDFVHSTMMRSVIEAGVKQGLKESFDQFAYLLAQDFRKLDFSDLSDRDHVVANLEAEKQSDCGFAIRYFWNFTVISTAFMFIYVTAHILLCEPRIIQGLEFRGLDLPDSFGELITIGILMIQLERIYNMVSHFVQARLQRGGDHGIKAKGDGWVLTVALIEGVNLSSLDSLGVSDPYVVFTCNGQTRTSSVKLQTRDPRWNEILEFEATEEPPSVLDMEVFDFDGPFNHGTSLGHAEINFLKHASTELADMWVSLEGKLAQSSQSKLNLRIFIDNNNGVETIKEYLTKMEKEVGKKLNLRSPHKNSGFQKLFGLPAEEFLISDFTCSVKRKIPLQGRLFLSARIVGFYSDLFGHKTKFFFLWDDIEDIQILPPSFSSVGSPTLLIVLRKGRGFDASHGAKSLDEEGRLRFYFQAFVSFNVASRTIMALWKTRMMNLNQRAEITEEPEVQEERTVMAEDTECVLDDDEANMSEINSLMVMFDGTNLEHKIMEKSGCLQYMTTLWEPVKPDVFERLLSHKLSHFISIFGGEVTSTQQKFPMTNDQRWVVNEVMTLHDVPFSDHFRVHFRYLIEKSGLDCNALSVV